MTRWLWLIPLLLLVACSKKLREEAPLPPLPVVLSDPTPMSIPAPPPAPPVPAAPVVMYAPQDMDRASPDGVIDAHARDWQRTLETAVSTFSVDVDTGSYSRARQQLRNGRLPSPYEVRSEEFLNYFDHGYTPPADPELPFSITTELAPAPWNPQRHLLLVGLQGRAIDAADLPPANLVFLIDTSGSMQDNDKLPLLRQGFRTLLSQLRAQDRVAIVAYAGSAGLVLPSTAGDQRAVIEQALDRLQAGGGTDGGAGIELAYTVARQGFIKGGINRVLLATDGDFNVGVSSTEALKRLVERRRDQGVSLSTLGFGHWGYNDQIAEQLADVGNGSHAFIDDALEARKVLVNEIGGTLLTIAKDVKIQLEFNPQQVARYRLLGYDNRRLRREDFNNDSVDAGEIGAGHDVTALYELELAPPSAQAVPLLATLRLRYKPPQSETSRFIDQRLLRGQVAAAASPRLQFAAAVVGFAERLRGNPDFAALQLSELATWVDTGADSDPSQQRAELADLIALAEALQPQRTSALR